MMMMISINVTVSELFDIIFQLTPLKLVVLSRIDYCISLFAGLPLSLISKLQRIQNCAARLIVRASSSVHITPILKQFYWLPIKTLICYKIACLCFNAINYSTPAHLSACICALLLNIFAPVLMPAS